MSFCKVEELKTESDVEQKFILPMLTKPVPDGLGYASSEIYTKLSIKRLEIGKGTSKKIHYPDYIILLAGLPMVILEAKTPGESLDTAIAEARLYASKINEEFPSGINPCCLVIASDGKRTILSKWDSNSVIAQFRLEDTSSAHIEYSKFVSIASRTAVEALAKAIRTNTSPQTRIQPTHLLGGQSVRNEEIGHNSFGSTLALDFRHLFNPTNLQERAYIVTNAYVSSNKRERYVEPIDKLIRGIVLPGISHLREFENSATPKELTDTLQRGKALERQVLLMVGSVGSGKSTFIDYLVNVALPKEVTSKTVWVRADMNKAPLDQKLVYQWILDTIISELKATEPTTDFDSLQAIEKVYSVELNKLRKGPLALLDATSTEYRTRVADRILECQKDRLLTANALVRFLCGERGKLLIVVLDNCDKRVRDEQLLMFQVAHWLQDQLKGLIILPLRDVTYELNRNEPPLDTALKDLVFRIEPPKFSEVLSARVALALRELKQRSSEVLAYSLPNGMKVEYPASDQGMYLACILRSLYEHDKFLRRIISGLAGRDIRRALEIFLEFCQSGHISDAEIFKIRQLKGDYSLPLPLVARVLLRMGRRFYDGDKSYIKNLFQANAEEPRPDHFVRVAILRWFDARHRVKGPSGIRGFHRSGAAIGALLPLGHDTARIRQELDYLLSAKCLIAEHQRPELLSDQDLLCISPAGTVHLEMLESIDYISACSEDVVYNDAAVAERIADRIGHRGIRVHFADETAVTNAQELLDYLKRGDSKLLADPNVFLQPAAIELLHGLDDVERALSSDIALHVKSRQKDKEREAYVGNLHPGTKGTDLKDHFAKLGFIAERVAIKTASDGSGRTIAFVTFADVGSRDSAIRALSGSTLAGHQLRLRPRRA